MLLLYTVASGSGGAGGLAPPVLKKAKNLGGCPPGFLKNDAHFEGILILVSQYTCK